MNEKDLLTMAKCQLELEKDFQILLGIVEEQAKKIECLEKRIDEIEVNKNEM